MYWHSISPLCCSFADVCVWKGFLFDWYLSTHSGGCVAERWISSPPCCVCVRQQLVAMELAAFRHVKWWKVGKGLKIIVLLLLLTLWTPRAVVPKVTTNGDPINSKESTVYLHSRIVHWCSINRSSLSDNNSYCGFKQNHPTVNFCKPGFAAYCW